MGSQHVRDDPARPRFWIPLQLKLFGESLMLPPVENLALTNIQIVSAKSSWIESLKSLDWITPLIGSIISIDCTGPSDFSN